MKENRKNGIRKERIIMIGSSALVMAALTMTGIYMRNESIQEQNDGYSIDFGELENQVNDGPGSPAGPEGQEEIRQIGDIPILDGVVEPQEGLEPGGGIESDQDYDPLSEVDSDRVEIPGLTDQLENMPGGSGPDGDNSGSRMDGSQTGAAGTEGAQAGEEDGTDAQAGGSDGMENAQAGDAGVIDSAQAQTDLTEQAGQPEGGSGRQLEFAEAEGLLRPASGEVLMPYSMDKSVYFSTLDQYKYNPAVMLVAAEGDSVCACAAGEVVSIFQDEELGQAMVLDLGSGYQATYGQLQNLTVSVGSYVNRGDILGYVAAPTKYFSAEGTNLYFKLTRDGVPVNPEDLFS